MFVKVDDIYQLLAASFEDVGINCLLFGCGAMHVYLTVTRGGCFRG